MSEGVVVGGWGFVWAAYALTAVGFLIYGITLVTRLKGSKNHE